MTVDSTVPADQVAVAVRSIHATADGDRAGFDPLYDPQAVDHENRVIVRGKWRYWVPMTRGDVVEVVDVHQPADLGHEAFDEAEVASGDPDDSADDFAIGV